MRAEGPQGGLSGYPPGERAFGMWLASLRLPSAVHGKAGKSETSVGLRAPVGRFDAAQGGRCFPCEGYVGVSGSDRHDQRSFLQNIPVFTEFPVFFPAHASARGEYFGPCESPTAFQCQVFENEIAAQTDGSFINTTPFCPCTGTVCMGKTKGL